ncbi:MAG: prepilin-type N-terminal cleavage/methylation domain-containing protein [Fuerstiella sp.]|nr:prepilin-type N-terminal cleavage/methylation domain-containing protein [Fuerstiella sp.]
MRSIHSHPTASHVKLTNSCPSGSSARVRAGYSLMEMLIVLAIMAAMAAFALPSLRGPLDKSRLRSSARQVRAALAKTRSLAIREGVPLVFQFEAGGRSWTIERKGASPLQQSTMTGDSRPLSGLKTGRAATENVLVNSHESSVLRQGLLPEGVTFAESPPLTEQSEGNVVADEPADVVGASFSELRSQSISFRPNGRSEDSTVTINGSRDFVVTVTVRGLTSAVSYSSPFRRASINVDDRIAALSDETTQ